MSAFDDAEGWREDGHELLGKRLAIDLDGDRRTMAHATVRKWLPEDPKEGEPALFRAIHDDGDEEELERCAAAAAAAAAHSSAHCSDAHPPHPSISPAAGTRCSRRWLRTTSRPRRRPGARGLAVRRPRVDRRARPPIVREGKAISVRLGRVSDGAPHMHSPIPHLPLLPLSGGRTIRKWLPEDPATATLRSGAPCDDGDEEDLEEHEVKEAVEAYRTREAVTFLNPGLSSALSSPAMSAVRAAAPAAAAAPPRGERQPREEAGRQQVVRRERAAAAAAAKPAAPPPPSRADRYAGRAALAPPPAAAAAAPASAKKPKPSPAAEKPRPSPARTTRHTRA